MLHNVLVSDVYQRLDLYNVVQGLSRVYMKGLSFPKYFTDQVCQAHFWHCLLYACTVYMQVFGQRLIIRR